MKNTANSVKLNGNTYSTYVYTSIYRGHSSEFSPGCAKTAKDFTKRFYDIVLQFVSSSFAVI